MSGHVVCLHGPLHWLSKRQSLTSCSLAEAEIYATDECVKDIQYISHILADLDLSTKLIYEPILVLNDNMACIQWCKNRTARGICHIQIRENAVREAVHNKSVEITHVAGKENLANLFTKEDQDTLHFLSIRDSLMSRPFPEENTHTQKMSLILTHTILPHLSLRLLNTSNVSSSRFEGG